ncbi:putative quinol monooxygenase [Actinopolymorpha singaporensis]
MPVTLIAKYHVTAGHSETVQAALTRMAERVRAEEPGCLVYQANRSTERDDLFCLYEVYSDEAALIAHRETPHFREIVEGEIVPLLDRREREVYTRVAG